MWQKVSSKAARLPVHLDNPPEPPSCCITSGTMTLTKTPEAVHLHKKEIRFCLQQVAEIFFHPTLPLKCILKRGNLAPEGKENTVYMSTSRCAPSETYKWRPEQVRVSLCFHLYRRYRRPSRHTGECVTFLPHSFSNQLKAYLRKIISIFINALKIKYAFRVISCMQALRDPSCMQRQSPQGSSLALRPDVPHSTSLSQGSNRLHRSRSSC